MKQNAKWIAYTELAWTEPIIAPPSKYAKETELFSNIIKEHSKIEVSTLLHLGCGAGGNDYTFKNYFDITGLDISENMLEIARQLNPEVNYHHGDMRTIELGECFDSVSAPDSVGYMTTEGDIRSTILTAYKHLKPGGVFLTVTNIAEQFSEYNFVYFGSRDDIDITVFENNYIPNPAGTTYEITFVYLIRHKGELEIYTDRYSGGIFKLETWLDLLIGAGFENIDQIQLEGSYDSYIVGEGTYPQFILVCNKPL